MQQKNLTNVVEITYIETTVSTNDNKNFDVKKEQERKKQTNKKNPAKRT